MRPIALYFATTHDDRAAAERNRRPRFAPVDALPLDEPAPVSRRGRLTASLRRHVARAASA